MHRGPEHGKVFLRHRLEATQHGSPMPTGCSANGIDSAPVGGRRVVAHFDAGVLLLGATDRAIGLIERLLVDLFLDAHARPLKEIVLDLDATDVPIHGHQEGRFVHGYDDCHCYLPLYVFCGRHLLAAKLRRSNIHASTGTVEEVECVVGQFRERWPRVRIILPTDSGFARDSLMTLCEANRVDYLFSLARNPRLVDHIAAEFAPSRSADPAPCRDGSRGLLAASPAEIGSMAC